jgi:hypothetical protein
MKKLSMIVALSVVPAVAVAQQQVTATAHTEARARAAASSETRLSAESRAQLEATFAAARERNLPEEPIRNRVAEGQAKAASEAQIVLAARRMEARLEATQEAMVRAGRSRPADAEVERGAQAMERGATAAQIEALVRHSPSDRSLVVSFDVLSRLASSGIAVDRAVAQIGAKLDARASDNVIAQLAGSANVGVVGAATGAAGLTSGVNGNVAGNAAGGGASVAGSVVGAVKIIKPPTP